MLGGIDAREQRVGPHDGALDAQIPVSLPQRVHRVVDPLPLIALDIVGIEGELHASRGVHQPRAADADAAQGLVPMVVAPEQVKGRLSDLRAGAGLLAERSLARKAAQFVVPDIDTDYRTA